MQALFLPTVVLLSSFIVALIGLTLYSLWHEEKHKKDQGILKKGLESALEDATTKATHLLQNARAQSDALLTEAELAGIHSIASKKVTTAHLEKQYEETLGTLTQETVKELGQATDAIKNRYDQFVTESENIISHHISANQQKLDDYMQALLQANNEAFASFLNSQQQKIDSTMNQQMENIHKLVETYAKKRYELIDAAIVDIVEETTRLTLKKSLSLKDQTDLILESLEEAKKQGIFSKDS